MEFRRSVFGTVATVTLASGLVLGTALSSQACIQAKVNSVVQSLSGLEAVCKVFIKITEKF
jgi:hypothetical protein